MTLYRECDRCRNDGFACPTCDGLGYVPLDPAALRETIARVIGLCVFEGIGFDRLTPSGQSSCFVAADAVLAAIGGEP